MIFQDLRSLKGKGLAEYADYLSDLEDQHIQYATLAGTIEGEFILREFEKRKVFAQSMYVNIDPNAPDALHALIALQECEREQKDWIDRIKNSRQVLADIADAKKAITRQQEERRKHQREQERFVAAGKKQEKSNG